MAKRRPRLIFRSVDTRPTPAGRILEAAHLRDALGTGWDAPRRFLVRAAVFLVHGGGLYRDTRGFEAEVKAGDMILVHPRIGHTYGPRAGGCWEEWYVTFDGSLFDALETIGVLDVSRPLWRMGDIASWRNRFKMMFPRSGRPVEALDQVGALAAFLLSASGLAKALGAPEVERNETWLNRAKQRLASPGDESGNLPALARECGVSYETFRKRFVILTGESPARHRRRMLIARAQSLMRERDLPDRAIADALGFCDEFHFSKTFKQITGCSPRQWRVKSDQFYRQE